MTRTQQKTLLVLSQVYVPDPAAVGQHMHEAAAEMARRGRRVRVVTSARGYDDPSRKFPLRQLVDGVHVQRIPFGSFGKRTILIRLMGQTLFLLQAMLSGLFTPRLGAILVSTSPPMCSIIALMIAAIRRVPVIYWVMDINPDQVVRMGLMSERALPVRAMEWLNRRILCRAHTIVTLDRFMAEALRQKADVSERMAIIPPWAPDGVEPIDHDDNSFRRRHGLTDNIVLMHSGNHSLSHPLDTFLQAAEQLRDRDDLMFLFVGGGRGKEAVDAAVAAGAPNIISLPYQPREQLNESLSAADVHLLSVGRESVGVVHPCKVYGAMAVARPVLVLSPAECHATDLADFERYGRHVEHGDVDSMVRTIRELADMASRRRALMGQTARETLAENYSQTSTNGQLARLIEDALAGRKPQIETSREHPTPLRRAA